MINKKLYEQHKKENNLARAKKEYFKKKHQEDIEHFHKMIGVKRNESNRGTDEHI
jgi:hypothetical protein